MADRSMESLAQSGILVGAALIPIIPSAGDDEIHLSDAVRATKDYGGKFVLARGFALPGVGPGIAAEMVNCFEFEVHQP